MSDTRAGTQAGTPTASGAVGTEPTVADLADDFVTAVCRPGDVEAARATVRRVDPVDLAGLVAAIDDHQPMTLEVAVDVLAELGVGPAAIAAAVGVDHEDVQVLLGAPLGGPPPPLPDRDARIIEVVAGRDDDGVVPVVGPADVAADEPHATDADGSGATGVVAIDDGITAGDTSNATADEDARGPDDTSPAARADDRGDTRGEVATATSEHVDASPAPLRIDSARDPAEDRAEPDEVTPATGGTDGAAPPREHAPNRGRVLWAVVLFVLLIGGMVALAALLGAF